jgi:hypothetical protein
MALAGALTLIFTPARQTAAINDATIIKKFGAVVERMKKKSGAVSAGRFPRSGAVGVSFVSGLPIPFSVPAAYSVSAVPGVSDPPSAERQISGLPEKLTEAPCPAAA